MRGVRELVIRLISIADEPSDDDDIRLRKRVAVVFACITVVAPVSVIGVARDRAAVGVPLGLSLSVLGVVNLIVLAQSRRFDRFVIVLISARIAFTVVPNILQGGVGSSSAAMMWAFLAPVFAILALGPKRAMTWFVIFLLALLGVVVIDPVVSSAIPAPPYAVRLFSYAFNIGAPAAIIFLLLRYTDIRRREAQARSEELLTNAIPMSIAKRLQHGEQRIAEAYPETTVLFSDIVGFTPWAQRTDPDRVVGLLDALFTRFDELAATCGVEKIKTIGDAYMAVAGAPDARADHAEAAIALARGMLDAGRDWCSANAVELELRIGLASGKVVAGVIGQKRILFDLWGDTVNTASRMESSGLPGRIQVAPATWELLREQHVFERRQVEVKGLGPMTTYLLAKAEPA
jgi:adenylate cyclase